MPFARRWTERHAWEEREARLSIVGDAGVDGGCVEGLAGTRGNPREFCLVPRPELLRPVQSQGPNSLGIGQS